VLWVVIAIVVGLLIVLVVGLAIHPDDGKQSNGARPYSPVLVVPASADARRMG
jgi:hypothetical protein